MKNSFKSIKVLDEKRIIESEQYFIDLFKSINVKKHPFKTLIAVFKGQYLKLIVAAILHIIKSSPIWVIPLISSDIINSIVIHPDNMIQKLIVDAIVATLFLAQNIPMHMLEIRFFSSAKRSVEAELRGAMIRKLQQLSISFHNNMSSGKIQSKVMRDVEAVSDFANSIFETVFSVGVQVFVALAVVLTRNIAVFLMFLVCVPLSVFIRKRFGNQMRTRNHTFRTEIENTSSAVLDMEELVPVTRAHALENKEIKKLTSKIISISKEGYRLDKILSLFGSVTWATIQFIQIVCLFFTATMAYKKIITIGEISLYQSYFATLVGGITAIMNLLPIITRGAESLSSISEILSSCDIEDNSNKKKIDTIKGKYEFKNVTFNYDSSNHVLSNFSLTVNPGETIALVGESGSGKSTIINLVIGFIKADSGCILIDGNDINELDLHEYRKMISVVPQKTLLFSGSIIDNITYGVKNITKKQIDNAVHMAQLDSVIEKMPNGLHTLVGEHGSKLSGGQMQRISIARAIIRNPQVIIFDEATSALDSITETEIQKAIENLTKERTTFIVAHRLSTIKNADKIAVLKDGKCVEYGTYDELILKRGEFYKYKIMQS